MPMPYNKPSFLLNGSYFVQPELKPLLMLQTPLYKLERVLGEQYP